MKTCKKCGYLQEVEINPCKNCGCRFFFDLEKEEEKKNENQSL